MVPHRFLLQFLAISCLSVLTCSAGQVPSEEPPTGPLAGIHRREMPAPAVTAPRPLTRRSLYESLRNSHGEDIWSLLLASFRYAILLEGGLVSLIGLMGSLPLVPWNAEQATDAMIHITAATPTPLLLLLVFTWLILVLLTSYP